MTEQEFAAWQARIPDRRVRCKTCGAAWSFTTVPILYFWKWADILRGAPCDSGPNGEGRCRFVKIRQQ
mgnify:CR=1 FL=1